MSGRYAAALALGAPLDRIDTYATALEAAVVG